MSLSKQFDMFMKRTDQQYQERENFQIQQDYIKMLQTEPGVRFHMEYIRTRDPDNTLMDV